MLLYFFFPVSARENYDFYKESLNTLLYRAAYDFWGMPGLKIRNTFLGGCEIDFFIRFATSIFMHWQ